MSYEVKDLKVLSPRDHVRLRKSMYIGDSADPRPLFNEIIDNALDEQNEGYSKLTSIVVDYDNNIYKIMDYGRGFPQGKLEDPNTKKTKEALELLCTTSFSGGKFGGGGYRIVTGLHGLGILVTNSLSETFNIKTWRDGQVVEYSSHLGETDAVEYCDALGEPFDESPSGTVVTFKPDASMFEDKKIPLSHIILRCKIANAFGMKINLQVIEDGVTNNIEINSDIYDLLPEEDEGISEYYRHTFTVKDEATGESASIALKYTSDTKTYYRGYTNLLYNSQGGSHHKMLDSALAEAWNKFDLGDIKSSDIYLGLRGVVAVFISHTEFSSQSKERLSVDKSVLEKLRLMIVDEIYKWLNTNDEIRKSLLKRFQEYRESQNKLLARKEIKSLLYVNPSKDGLRRASVVRTLRECSSKTRDNTELFIVEGDSALGSAVQARDILTQAVLPVRGKVFNVARCSDPKDALTNEETRSIINAIAAGIGDDSDPAKSRYDRIIFMADADPDGLEIGVLLAGMFVNLLPNLVKAGMVYVSLPPLYGWKDKSGAFHFTNNLKEIPEKVEFTRYKGLGEMDADELRTAVMDPSTRRLIKLNFPDDLKAFNSVLTSSSVKFKLLEDQGVVRYEL